jgi:sugar/nucleoside kinase (ribokinase family)
MTISQSSNCTVQPQPTESMIMPDTHTWDVIGLGTVVVDHVVVLPRHPDADTKNAMLSDHLQVGGPVPTALAQLRRFGRRCAMVGSWSDDAYGQLIDSDLQAEGIETRFAVREPGGRSGFAHVWVCAETARRTIAYQRTTRTVAPNDLDRSMFAAARAVHLDGWPPEAALAAAQLGREFGCLVTLDAGSPKPGVEALIREVDGLNVPRHFLSQFFGIDDVIEGIRRLLRMGPRIVTVTSGDRGAAVGTADGCCERPAFLVNAVDTTGAGDVFSGALVHSLLEEWTPDRVLEFAMATAACKCQGLGNREALPRLSDVEGLLSAQRTDD